MKKNKTFKRFLAFLLCAAMMVTYMPSSVYTLANEDVDGTQAVTQEEPAAAEAEDSAPAAEEQAEEPAPAAEEQAEEPAPAAEEQAEEPAPAAEEQAEEPAPASEEQAEEPAPAAEEQVEEPAPASEGQAEEPSPAAEEQAAEPEEGAEEVSEPEQAKEEPEEEVGYPAQHFEESTAIIGGVKVIVDAPEGAFPEGTTMKVKDVTGSDAVEAVNDLGDNLNVIKAVDVTFYDAKGKEIEPKEGSDPLSVSFISSKFAKKDDLSVVHIDNDNKAEKLSDGVVENNCKEVVF